MYRLNTAFSRYEQALRTLSEVDRDVAIDIIFNLADAIEHTNKSIRHEKPSNELKLIRNYIIKKLAEAHSPPNSNLESRDSLIHFKNELVHGKFHRKFNANDIKRLAPFFWKVLEKSAPRWNPRELSNILAYCLYTIPNINDILSSDPKKIVRLYKAIFYALNEDQQTMSFIELTLRILSEPIFKGTLDSMLST